MNDATSGSQPNARYPHLSVVVRCDDDPDPGAVAGRVPLGAAFTSTAGAGRLDELDRG